MFPRFATILLGSLCGVLWAAAGGAAIAQSAQPQPLANQLQQSNKLSGGLCVQVGCEDLATVGELARTGRFLVQVLDGDSALVERAQKQIQAEGFYGIFSADRLPSTSRLPYTENLVNLLILAPSAAAKPAWLTEAFRVLRPEGVILLPVSQEAEDAIKAAGFQEVHTIAAERQWLAGRKPRPAAMDEWSHARHGADGNTASRDTLVGPPRRVRWVTGPTRENSRLITAAGRNFYADVLARDAFNGLRLWQRPLKASGPAIPVAADDLLFAVAGKRVMALDAVTGQTVREYREAGTPGDLMVVDGTLVTVDNQSVRAIEISTGRLRWKFAATDPRYVIAGDGSVYLLTGSLRRGDNPTVVCLDLANGQVRWQKDDYPWGPKIRRVVYHEGLVVYEVSTQNNDKPGNAIHVAAAADGRVLWSREFVPGMNHAKQARAMFLGDLLWILEDRKCVALDPKTGKEKKDCPAGLCHCFPPVATERFMFSGEMELTDLESGQLDANRITKAACSRDYGWVPANGLIYVCPKHCVCWPMLRGYTAMAPAAPASDAGDKPADCLLEKGIEAQPENVADADWPCYRQGAWRGASVAKTVPSEPKPLWKTSLGAWPDGTIAEDWQDNPFVRGPVTAPVIAAGLVFVARPDAHQLVALDARSGEVSWRYTANGRVDTPPTIYRGLCLFGSKSGWVYCLRARDGQLVWRLRAAPNEERIVAYGQVESPWPVPGSVLVIDDVAYFAAGRHPLADGGIRVFAVEPASGQIRWTRRLDSLPVKNFYASSGLEFDNFDLLQQAGNAVVMSRWSFDRTTGEMDCKPRDAFLALKGEGLNLWAPRGCWSYAPRHQPRHRRETPQRGLAVFRANTLLGCLDDGRTVYRRDFRLDQGEKFDPTWMTGWAAGENSKREHGEYWLSHRLAKQATWSAPVFTESQRKQRLVAMVWAGDSLFAAGNEGGLIEFSAADGKVVARTPLDAPVWDGMAAAHGRLFVATQKGDVVCLGKE